MYINFSISELDSIAAEVLAEVADDLINDHPWNNDTKELQESIKSDNNELRIEAEHATFVDFQTPYIEELIEEIDTKVQHEIEMYIEGI